jgi:methylenetetrahydrofolate dehydrogenase (NADP+)/methenyltetrahydrofolate cyclohydrolase
MSYTLIDGKETSKEIKAEIAEEVAKIKAAGGKVPHLAAILVGGDGASETYVNSKVKACAVCGFESTLIRLDTSVTEEELLAKVELINNDDNIDGLIVQLPLPDHISVTKVTKAIKPEKDVDGFHEINLGRMLAGEPSLLPATPLGITMLLKKYNVETQGKHCVVIGRSHIVGTPMSVLMNRPFDCTVTLAHRHTHNLKEFTQMADIIVIAIGKPEFLTADFVKEGVTIIDVGITRVEDANAPRGYVIKGDVEFVGVSAKAKAITPVPGGVGPMTIAALLKNTLLATTGV